MYSKKALIFIATIIIVTAIVFVLYGKNIHDDVYVVHDAIQSEGDVYENIHNDTVQKPVKRENTSTHVEHTKVPQGVNENKQKAQEEKEIREHIEQWYKPKPMTSWHWQLQGTINTVYDVEMYDIDLEETPQSVIDQLHAQGKKVICYFSAGTYEPFRSDAGLFAPKTRGKSVEGWE